MRLFFALEIPGDARSQIDLVAENVRRAHPGGRSVPADNLHVTLYFAGTCGPVSYTHLTLPTIYSV